MFTHKYNTPLLRQEGGDGGAGVPPQTFDFDIEKVKAAGFIPKDEFEKTEMTWKNNVKKAEENAHKKYLSRLDEIADNELQPLFGIERLKKEENGKIEFEKLSEYVKRGLETKKLEPLEQEKKLRETFSKKEKEYNDNLSKLQQENIYLRYDSEYQGAASKVLASISDEKEFEKANKVLTAIVNTEYQKEYSAEYNRFVYKDNNGEIIAKNGEPKTTKEILAEVADIYLPKNMQQPRGVGNAKFSNNNSQKIYTRSDAHNMLAQKGLVIGTVDYQIEYSKLVKEHNIKT